MAMPQMIRIRQRFAAPIVDDIAGEIARQIGALQLEREVMPGQSVAVGCSSRGIANYAEVVSAVVGGLKRLGADPFLVPAMGSHGSATAEGQKRVLEGYGLT